MRHYYLATALSTVFAIGLASKPAVAQHDHQQHERGEKTGHSHERAEAHGGAVTMSKEFHVETVFLPEQVRLYLYDAEQNPIHVKHWEKGSVAATGEVQFRSRGRGTATLSFVRATPDGYACPMHADQTTGKPGTCAKCGMDLAKQPMPEGTLWSCPMHPDENGKRQGKCADCGMKLTPQDYLVAAADLEGVKAGEARVTINLTNLPGTTERTLQFAEKFTGAKAAAGDEHEDHDDGHEDHDDGHGDGDHGHGDHDH